MPHMGYQDDITRGAVWSGLSDARSCAFYMLNWADKLQTTEKLFVEWHPRTNLIADNPALEAFLDAFDAQTADGGTAQPTHRTTLMSAEDVVKYDQHVRPEHWERVYEDALKSRAATEAEAADTEAEAEVPSIEAEVSSILTAAETSVLPEAADESLVCRGRAPSRLCTRV